MDCNATYVGQTKRQVKTKMHEHQSDINRNSTPSVISSHKIETNHEFDWGEVKILDKEQSYYKRLTSEMIYIKKQNHGLNKQSDTESLSESYLPILNLLSST